MYSIKADEVTLSLSGELVVWFKGEIIDMIKIDPEMSKEELVLATSRALNNEYSIVLKEDKV